MKLAQVNKLYGKLTPKEQANLYFEAIARRDDTELAAILDTVAVQTYQQYHLDYMKRSTGLVMVSLVYGSTYWKTRALILANQEPDENRAFLAVIDTALKNACSQLNIDINAIRTMAQCEREPLMTNHANLERVAEYTEMLIHTAR